MEALIFQLYGPLASWGAPAVGETRPSSDHPGRAALLGLLASALVALAVIGIDILVPRKRLDTISAVYFGMIVGLFLTYVVYLALGPLWVDAPGAAENREAWVEEWLEVMSR